MVGGPCASVLPDWSTLGTGSVNARTPARPTSTVVWEGSSFGCVVPVLQGATAGRHGGGTVQIAVDGELVRSHPIRHDRVKEHGGVANPPASDGINAAPPRSPSEAV